MKATFDNTVSILVKAYMNDTLEHGNYCACAVGNLIADAVGAKIVLGRSSSQGSKLEWNHPKYKGGEWYFSTNKTALEQISTTGYSWYEINLIERAFETEGKKFGSDDELMFNGLMAVVDVLAEIHGIDLEQKESAKALFVK